MIASKNNGESGLDQFYDGSKSTEPALPPKKKKKKDLGSCQLKYYPQYYCLQIGTAFAPKKEEGRGK
jgi:hypothetical protein